MTLITRKWLHRSKQDDGQTLVEYALIIMLISIALVGSLSLLANGLSDFLSSATDIFAGAGS